MEEALIARLRASDFVAAATGRVGGRPAVDLHERKSDEPSAFAAAVVTIISPGRTYDQDGADAWQRRRVRFECFGLSAGDSIILKRALVAELEIARVVAGVSFMKSQLQFERSFDPEDLATLRIFRTIADFTIPSNG